MNRELGLNSNDPVNAFLWYLYYHRENQSEATEGGYICYEGKKTEIALHTWY